MDPENKLVTIRHIVPAFIQPIGSARTGEHTNFHLQIMLEIDQCSLGTTVGPFPLGYMIRYSCSYKKVSAVNMP